MENAPPVGYNAYEWNLVQSQGLTNYSTWENGRLVEINVEDIGQTGALNFSNCTSLRWLTLGGAEFSSLNVSGCINLLYLDCSAGDFTYLNVSNLSSLRTLICNTNLDLTSLNFSGCTNLQTLDCGLCDLTSLDVSGFNGLQYLDCKYNELISLNVSGTGLLGLNCFDNNLTSLNLSGLDSLSFLSCYKNSLTSINLNNTGFKGYTTIEQSVLENEIGVYRYIFNYLEKRQQELYVDKNTQVVLPPKITVAVPKNFKAVPQASRNVNLTWSAVPGATHYQIYWKNTKGKNVVIGTSETASFRTPRVAVGSNTFYVYAWTGDVRSKGYATVTTRVGTAALIGN